MKLPLMRPSLEAVLFGFERIGMIIRIAWLPIVIVILLYVGTFLLLAGGGLSSVDLASSDPEEAIAAALSSGGFVAAYILLMTVMPFVAMVVLSCVYVAVIRAATYTDFETPSLPFYFALGGRELRYFVTKLLYAILIAVSGAIAFGLIAATIGLTALAAETIDGQAAALIVAPGAALTIWIVLIWLWIVLRFLPVLPIAAVENRISFDDAWRLTKGNFWRLLISGAFFVSILQGVLMILFVLFFMPAAVVIGLLAVAGFGVVGAASFALFALLGIVLIPAAVALASFGLAAEAAYPARVYAYLTGCGDDCRIY